MIEYLPMERKRMIQVDLRQIEETLGQFSRFDMGVVDTSSLIYMEKGGFPELAAQTVSLVTINEVSREWGEGKLPIEVIPSVGRSDDSTDQKLLLTAASRGLPLISEDKKLLMAAGARGLPYFNSLVVLIFIYYKRKISVEKFTEFRERLLEFARYSPGVIAYGEALFERVGPSLTPHKNNNLSSRQK